MQQSFIFETFSGLPYRKQPSRTTLPEVGIHYEQSFSSSDIAMGLCGIRKRGVELVNNCV
jgi:hypothetical protein